MGALSITAANVSRNSGTMRTQNASTAITAGQALYVNSSGLWALCDSDAAGTADCDGIALHAAETGQPLTVLNSGTLDLGATLAVGVPYFVHTTAGAIGLEGDISSGDFTTYLGTALAADNFALQIHNAGTAKA